MTDNLLSRVKAHASTYPSFDADKDSFVLWSSTVAGILDDVVRLGTPTPQSHLRVKPLVWRVPKPDSPKDPEPEEIALCADGIGGIYSITRKQTVGPERLLWWVDDPFTWDGYASIVEAKAAAQSDHEARVLSCLATSASEGTISEQSVNSGKSFPKMDRSFPENGEHPGEDVHG